MNVLLALTFVTLVSQCVLEHAVSDVHRRVLIVLTIALIGVIPPAIKLVQ